MMYRLGLILFLMSCFAFWQGCGQTDINESDMNNAVSTADTKLLMIQTLILTLILHHPISLLSDCMVI